ncbi:dimethylsulfonioproprionate lyase family protein [Alteromonas sp. C1M14]|uniref:dimethylsulfonioproprionate lyase family protein n=1 Tax=Alteromonas sp. C1M14 TaxID=2841567 RepID=UPI001C086DAD|nr:dimethylsulfonioproprionate lyase family protein [Alteromonas sp. C1M14]MBU2979641.1 dimethylsulfoniopropionate lyase [Alteromonas sp. C1M14]
MRVKAIDEFVASFVLYLQQQPSNADIEKAIHAAERFLSDDSMVRSEEVKPALAPVTRWLTPSLNDAKLAGNSHSHLAPFCQHTEAVLPHCPWTPGYDEAVVGAEFKQHFAYAVLVGDGGIVPCDYFAAGITLIGPDFFYDWHHHPAIEIYMNLTDNSLWGLNNGPLTEKRVGEIITHPSEVSHAMFCKTAPLLAPWLWAGEVNVPAAMC